VVIGEAVGPAAFRMLALTDVCIKPGALLPRPSLDRRLSHSASAGSFIDHYLPAAGAGRFAHLR